MRLPAVALALPLLAAAAACGPGSGADAGRGSRTADPPGAPTGGGPPAARLETRAGTVLLGLSTHCWEGACADFAAPACGDEHVPDVTLEPGETVRVVLGFAADEVAVTQHGVDGAAPPAPAPLGDDLEWTAEEEGAFSVFARAAGGGDASYVGCIRLR